MPKSITMQFAQAGEIYKYIIPGPAAILKAGKIKKIVTILMQTPNVVNAIRNRKRLPKYIGEQIGNQIVSILFSHIVNKPIHKIMSKAAITRRPLIKKNGIGGRTWFSMDGDRNVQKMVIMYHDANRAKKHLDIHIGPVSFIVRISGKPVESKIRYNSEGMLTNDSKDALINHLRVEIANNSRLAQNMDHSIVNARSSWKANGGPAEGYGSGKARQIVCEEAVEIMDVGVGPGQTARLYCPKIWKHGQTYIHKLYPGKGKNPVPIVIWGITKPVIPEFEDRLHLTKIDPDQVEKFKIKVDPATVTRKYDSASAHFDSRDGRTTFWSPRISKETGRRIEYSHKIPELWRTGYEANPSGMGELLFKKRPNLFNPGTWFDNQYLSAAEAGGILNADRVRPLDIIPDFRIYRIDRWNGKNVINLDFFANRSLADDFSKSNRFMNLPEFSEIKKIPGWEGLVGVPKEKGILDGIKIKWIKDPIDWKIEDVQLERGPKGRIAGVVWFKSLESCKVFKLGASQLGDDKFVLEIMNNPKVFVGQVFEIVGKMGHEGRSAKIIKSHLDKGVG